VSDPSTGRPNVAWLALPGAAAAGRTASARRSASSGDGASRSRSAVHSGGDLVHRAPPGAIRRRAERGMIFGCRVNILPQHDAADGRYDFGRTPTGPSLTRAA